MTTTFYVESSAAVAKVTCPTTFGKKLFSSTFLRAYVPSLRVSKEVVSNFDCEIVVTRKNRNSVRVDYPSCHYSARDLEVKDVVSLIEYMLERARQERGVFCIHSACAVYKEKAVIFWGGATGMGKTLGAISLARLPSSKMFSDEKTLIDLKKRLAVGGINKIYLLKKYLRDRYNAVGYKDIKPYRSETIPISMMVYPFIGDQKKPSIEKWGKEKFSWHLYEELCRKIRGTSRRFFDNSTPIDSLDTISLAKKRIRHIDTFIDRIPCYCIKMDSHDLVRNISILHNKI